MRKLTIYMLCVLGVGALGACAGGSTDTSTAKEVAAGSPTETDDSTANGTSQLLYALRGEGSVDGTTLDVVTDGEVTWITDRPDRRTGRMHPGSLVEGWDAAGFTEDPPNAILLTADTSVAVELTAPTWNDSTRTLSFAAAALEGGPLPAGDLGAVELFIDDQETCLTTVSETLTVNNLPASSTYGGCVFNTSEVEVSQELFTAENDWQKSHPDVPVGTANLGPEFPAEVFDVSFMCHSAYGDFFCYGPETPTGQASLSITT